MLLATANVLKYAREPTLVVLPTSSSIHVHSEVYLDCVATPNDEVQLDFYENHRVSSHRSILVMMVVCSLRTTDEVIWAMRG